jgi:hypothetical protein
VAIGMRRRPPPTVAIGMRRWPRLTAAAESQHRATFEHNEEPRGAGGGLVPGVHVGRELVPDALKGQTNATAKECLKRLRCFEPFAEAGLRGTRTRFACALRIAQSPTQADGVTGVLGSTWTVQSCRIDLS